MNTLKFFRKYISLGLAIVFLAGCAAPLATLTPASPLTPVNSPGGSQPQNPLPGPTNAPLPLPTESTPASLLKLIQTVAVTPNEHFSIGEGGVIYYVPATDRLVAIVQTKIDHPVTLSTSEVCQGKVIGYMEYTKDMQPTGKYGYLACGTADERSRLVGNDLYLSKMDVEPGKPGSQNGQIGWMLEKFDATSWKELASTFVALNSPDEQSSGPDVSFINGQIVVTSQYASGGQIFNGTHNHLFTTDLEPVGKQLLTAPEYPPNFSEVSMLQLSNGDILLFTSNSPKGDLIVLRLDRNWKFLEQRVLRTKAYFPTGSATDGQHFFIAYSDISNAEVDSLAGQNDRLAVFDTQWNLLQDVALTDVQSTPDSFDYGENPWITLQGNRLYVAYLISKLDPDTHALIDTQMYVNTYEITQQSGG